MKPEPLYICDHAGELAYCPRCDHGKRHKCDGHGMIKECWESPPPTPTLKVRCVPVEEKGEGNGPVHGM